MRPPNRTGWPPRARTPGCGIPSTTGFCLVMLGFFLQWPTIPTLVMFPILVIVYTRLARAEEREVAARFDGAWQAYAAEDSPRP